MCSRQIGIEFARCHQFRYARYGRRIERGPGNPSRGLRIKGSGGHYWIPNGQLAGGASGFDRNDLHVAIIVHITQGKTRPTSAGASPIKLRIAACLQGIQNADRAGIIEIDDFCIGISAGFGLGDG